MHSIFQMIIYILSLGPFEAWFQNNLKAKNAQGNFHINAEIIYTEKSKTFSMDNKVFGKMFKR